MKWQVKYQIVRFPAMLKGISSMNFLFSPSMDRFIDINFQESKFVIRQSVDAKIIKEISKGMISISFKGRESSKEAIRPLASRISFHSENEIRIITKEGLDCIYDFENDNLRSAVAVDNFDQEDFEDPHAIHEKISLDPKDTIKRLMRKCNNIKCEG